MDDPSNMKGPKEEQDVPTGDPVPDSTGDPQQQDMNTDASSNNHHDDDHPVVAPPPPVEETPKATPPPQEQNDEVEKTREMPTDLAGLAATVAAAPAGSPEDPASKMDMEEAMHNTGAATAGTPQVPQLVAQGGPEGTAAHAVNNGTLPMHGMEMTGPMPEGGVPTTPTDAGAMMPNNTNTNNTTSPSSMLMAKHAVPALADNNNNEEEDEGDDEEEEDQVQENSRRPDNEWQPPKKRRRKPEPMKPFNDMLYELLAFRAREGHCRVPLDTKSALGRWVASLRTQKSNLRKGFHSLDLSQERLDVLNSVGFVWDLQQFDSDSRWKRQYEELAAFKAEHGHCNVPQSTPLGKWVKMQRENYRETQLKASGQLPTGRSKPRPTLSQFRIEQLEALGFNWKVAAPAVGWEHRFSELLDYRRVHGDCNVPQAWQENRQLGRWVMKQRCQYTLRQKGEKNQLSDERVARLEDIGFSWTAPSFRKKKEGGREFPTAPPPPPPANHHVPQPPAHLLPPAGHPHQGLPPHDFRRWV